MNIFKKEKAITAFYYLMAVDGKVTEDEIAVFDEIGMELDPANFHNYRDQAIQTCIDQISKAESEEEYYDVISEGIDFALSERVDDPEDGVPPRLLLWDLLVIAYSNEKYDQNERKLIRHIVRVMDISRSVYLEMERIADTSVSIKREYELIQILDRPYAEIRPIVDELEERMKVIRKSALDLISDEIIEPGELEEKETSFERIRDSIVETVSPQIEKASDVFETAKRNVTESLTPWGEEVKKRSNKLFNSLSQGAKETVSASKKAFLNFNNWFSKDSEKDTKNTDEYSMGDRYMNDENEDEVEE